MYIRILHQKFNSAINRHYPHWRWYIYSWVEAVDVKDGNGWERGEGGDRDWHEVALGEAFFFFLYAGHSIALACVTRGGSYMRVCVVYSSSKAQPTGTPSGERAICAPRKDTTLRCCCSYNGFPKTFDEQRLAVVSRRASVASPRRLLCCARGQLTLTLDRDFFFFFTFYIYFLFASSTAHHNN